MNNNEKFVRVVAVAPRPTQEEFAHYLREVVRGAEEDINKTETRAWPRWRGEGARRVEDCVAIRRAAFVALEDLGEEAAR